MTPKEQAALTIKALEKRKESKRKGIHDAEQFRSAGRLEAKNKRNKRYY